MKNIRRARFRDRAMSAEEVREMYERERKNPGLSAPVAVVLTVVLLALLVALIVSGGSGCAHSPSPAPAGPSCAEVCARAEQMGCGWAAPTPLGTPCSDVCSNAEAARVPWKTECLSKIQSCDERCP